MTLPRLLLCGFGSFPAAPRNPSAAVVEAIAAERWSPPAVTLDTLVLPVAWARSVETISASLAGRPADGVLVVGVAVEAQTFRVETLGRNRACLDRLDHDGRTWPSAIIRPDAADLAATAPTQAMAQAIAAAGLPVQLSDDAGDYLCNFTLFQLLAAGAAPAVGFLHVPQARELQEGAAFDLADIAKAVRAATGAFADALSRPDASRRTA